MNKRELILNATLSLVTTRGLYDTPMALVASEAGVAAGTIYHYFDNKEKLIIDLYADSKEKMGAALLQKRDPSASYQRQFVQYWRNLYHFYLDNPKIFKFLEQFDNSPFYDKITKEENEKHYRPVIEFLNQGVEERILKPVHIELMVGLLHGSIAAVVKMALLDPEAIDRSRLIKAIEISWDGLKLRTISNE